MHIRSISNFLDNNQEAEGTKRFGFRQLILNILEDEQKHHRVLTELLEILKKKSSEWDAYLYDLITGFPKVHFL